MGPRTRLALILLVLTVVLGACSSTGTDDVMEPVSIGDPVEPAPWDLSDPETAVRSYLDWVSFSYRMVNSEIPTATMTPIEGVRVDSYIELNRQQGQGIEQRLVSLDIKSSSIESTRAVVTASEEWRYRYFSIESLKYVSDELTASYETTYTLLQEDGKWLVDEVTATSLGEIE